LRYINNIKDNIYCNRCREF